MPSGPTHWHLFWENDAKPIEYLISRGFKLRSGIITPRNQQAAHGIDNLDLAAIEYLCAEWDYGYEPAHKEPDPVRSAATELVRKIELIHEHQAYRAVWAREAIRGMPYCGPTYEEELEALKLSLGMPQAGEEEAAHG